MTAADEWERAVGGHVFTPSDEGFDAAVRGHNHSLVHRPDVVVVADNAEDVAATVRIAGRHGLRVQVQATGHGPSQVTRGGVLLRTGALNAIEVDLAGATVRVGAGVTWGDLMDACAGCDMAPLGWASVASVGVAGYLLGGGMGPLGRVQGFGADHVLAIEVIDAAGRARTVDADHDADLFWALRGGRLVPAVVTAFTLRLARAPELFAATLTYDGPDVAAALAGYASWQPALSDATTSIAALLRFPDLPALPAAIRGRRLMQVTVVHAGDEATGRAALDRLISPHPPESVDADVTDPARWMRSQPPIPPGPSWQRGMMLRRFDAEVAAEAVAAAGPEVDAPWQVVEIRPMGGALARPPAIPNAVGGRSDGVLFSVVSPTSDGSQTIATAYAGLAERMRRWVMPGVHINFHGPEDTDHPLRAAWPADTYRRLAAIRVAHDPAGIFPVPNEGP